MHILHIYKFFKAADKVQPILLLHVLIGTGTYKLDTFGALTLLDGRLEGDRLRSLHDLALPEVTLETRPIEQNPKVVFTVPANWKSKLGSVLQGDVPWQ